METAVAVAAAAAPPSDTGVVTATEPPALGQSEFIPLPDDEDGHASEEEEEDDDGAGGTSDEEDSADGSAFDFGAPRGAPASSSSWTDSDSAQETHEPIDRAALPAWLARRKGDARRVPYP